MIKGKSGVKSTLDLEMGQRIKAIRERKGISIKDLAKAVGLNPNMIYYYEGGKSQATVFMIDKICKYLGVPFSEVFEGRFLSDFSDDSLELLALVKDFPESKREKLINIIRSDSVLNFSDDLLGLVALIKDFPPKQRRRVISGIKFILQEIQTCQNQL